MKFLRGGLVLLLGVLTGWPAMAAESRAPVVVINEVLYHPAGDRDDLQFIELHNPTASQVDVSGWSFSRGVEFVFPRGTDLPPEGYLLIGRDMVALRAQVGPEVTIAGVFTGTLRHGGERLELVDAQRHVVDAVKYGDRAPWPLGADGYGGSLERICPTASGTEPANWAAAPAASGATLGGSPGRANTCYSKTPLPVVSEVRCAGSLPGRPIEVTARAADGTGVTAVRLAWYTWGGEAKTGWTEVPMTLQSGDAYRGVYAGQIPAQEEGRLIRFVVKARNASAAERVCPATTEPRSTFSCATFLNTNTARIPFLQILTPRSLERAAGSRRTQPFATPRVGLPGTPPAWDSAVIYAAPGQSNVQIFDHVQVRSRKGGFKIHFHRDERLDGMTGINVIFENSPRWVLAEPLAYEVYRRAGVPAPAAQHVRLWLDRQPLGYHLLVEQPNREFLRRQSRDPSGDLYKLVWYGRGLVDQHEKKTNPHTGHGDLAQLVNGLKANSGPAQWDFIRQHFNVDEVIDYFAVNACLQNWDGYWNNYYAYHDLRPGGKWEVFPWDEDKTWGDYDGASVGYDWYEMPLTFGRKGDQPPKRSWFGMWPVEGAEWWRPPGYFSGPLLDNSEFRQRYLARVRELCETVFTPERLGPVIRELEERLEPEVRVRAQLKRQPVEGALREFHREILSFHNQIAGRRRFLLAQLAAAPSPK